MRDDPKRKIDRVIDSFSKYREGKPAEEKEEKKEREQETEKKTK